MTHVAYRSYSQVHTMQRHARLLGFKCVTEIKSESQIKQAYYALAKIYHPDSPHL